MEKLSVIIITKNEELDIQECLKSLADLPAQIVVVDDFSTDKTTEMARDLGAEVHQKRWNGFGAQKQFALDQARHPWVLNVDADERLSPELRKEIATLLASRPSANGYQIPFELIFMGQKLRFGGCGGESHPRLFRKSKSHYPLETVHESIWIEPPVGFLKHPVRHYSYRNLSEYLDKCNRYTTLLAQNKWKQGKRFHWWVHGRLPMEFVKRYLLQLGFLDGQPGFAYAVLSAYYSWLKLMKLADVQKLEPRD